MAIEVTVPEMGESVLEATVSQWFKKEGEYVNVGDVLVELETDKVNVEVGAKGAGVLQQIKVQQAFAGPWRLQQRIGTLEPRGQETPGFVVGMRRRPSTAFEPAAPVFVGIMLSAAARARRRSS